MSRHAFNFQDCIARNEHLLKPPVGNRHLFDEETGMVIMVIGGPNQRTDYNDDPVDGFFYQIRGDMLLKVSENGEFYDVPSAGRLSAITVELHRSILYGFDCV